MTTPPDTLLNAAISAHRAGRLTEAEVGYRRVLRKRPNDPGAYYGLGLLEFHRGAVGPALELLRKCTTYAPGHGRAWNTMGSMLRAVQDAAGAQSAYRRATEAASDMSEAWYNLGICLRDDGDLEGAAEALHRATVCTEPNPQAFAALASLQYQRGQTAAAAAAFKAWGALDPHDPRATHMIAATTGQNVPSRASDGYVTTHFDAAADTFDVNLRNLGYSAPQAAADALAHSARGRPPHKATGSNPDIDGSLPLRAVLDVGCGTGLGGPLLRPLCTRLAGIDLSPRMLGHARARGCYDELVIAELVSYLRSLQGIFDAVVCTDTLVYFGELGEALHAANSALGEDGILVFTVESLPPRTASGHQIQPSGRYAHSEPYLRSALLTAGFELEALTAQTLREERAQPVGGYLVVARRNRRSP